VKKVLATVVVVAGIATGGVAAPVAADPVGLCPDAMNMVPASQVPNGDKKDKNHNRLVCAKFQTADVGFNGGPDDNVDNVVDDFIP
jgi:hypothetical protein